jgi:hypothetical protein
MARSRSSRSVSRFGRRFLVVLDMAITYPFLVMVGVLAGLGMLRMGLVGTTLAGAGSAAVAIWLARACRADLLGRPVGGMSDTSAIAAATVGVTAFVGWTQVPQQGALLGLIAIGLGGVVMRWRLSERLARSRGCCADRPVRAHELADLLGRLPTDLLLGEWQRSGLAIARHPGLAPEAALVGLRAMLMDELEARDAKGFSAWQRAAGRRPCSPVPFLGDDA